MSWFGSLHSGLQHVGERTRVHGLKLVAPAFCVPVFKLSHFFFKFTYLTQHRKLIGLRRECVRLGRHDSGLQLDNLSLNGNPVVETFHDLRNLHNRLE